MGAENLSANVQADIKVSATKSQALPLALVGLSALSLVAGFIFLWQQPEKCWLPILLSLVFAGSGGWLWWRSHKSSELDGGSPTEVVDASRGLRVTTDSRSLESPIAVQHLAELVSQVAHRQELPEPDGMINSIGTPDPSRKGEASHAVALANGQAEAVVRAMAKYFCSPNPQLSAPTEGLSHADANNLSTNFPLER